jgi:hypothetical protein
MMNLVAMDKLAELIDAARGLSPAERRRLIGELDALERQEPRNTVAAREPLAALLAVAATVHSDFADLSTDKYAHVAASALDPET